MNTLNGIRELALAATLSGFALIASADAVCSADIADLGSLTVKATRLPASYADLGSLTVTATRTAEARMAHLGSLTVTATRIEAVTLAAQAPHGYWN
jgi:hypothetical protein